MLYPCCEIKRVPRVDSKLSPPEKDTPTVTEVIDEEVEDEEVETIPESVPNSSSYSQSQPKVTSTAARIPKKSSKGVKSTGANLPLSPVASPQGKLKRPGGRSLGALPKLCNPIHIATVHRDHLPLLKLNILPLLNPEITGEQFFHRLVQYCNTDKAKNLVLVSRPFKSNTGAV